MLIKGLKFRFSEYFMWISCEIISARESQIAKGQQDNKWCSVPRDVKLLLNCLILSDFQILGEFIWFIADKRKCMYIRE